MGSDEHLELVNYMLLLFQSTLPHGERLYLFWVIHTFKQISIHTPTWGATKVYVVEYSPTTDFNPHSHMGSDTLYYLPSVPSDISIHTPTWGATSKKIVSMCNGMISIHTPTWGATFGLYIILSKGLRFQSTLPHGERLTTIKDVAYSYLISIHTPTWGATSVTDMRYTLVIVISIHTPTWGATNIASCVAISISYFNPHSHMGSDSMPQILSTTPVISIHTPTWGATLMLVCNLLLS